MLILNSSFGLYLFVLLTTEKFLIYIFAGAEGAMQELFSLLTS
jgi:hypothetical protein